MHKEIDDAMNQREEACRENKMKHHDILRKKLDEIKQSLSLMQDELQALNEMENSNEVSPTILFNSKKQDFYKLPHKLHISMPIFLPKQIETAEVCSLIGKIIPLSSTEEESVFKEKKPNALVKELLDQPVVLQVIKTGHENLHNVTCLKKEKNVDEWKYCYHQMFQYTRCPPEDNQNKIMSKRYSCLP